MRIVSVGNNHERQGSEMVFDGFNVQVMTMHTVRLILESHWKQPDSDKPRSFQFLDPSNEKLLPRTQEATTKLKHLSKEEEENLEVFVHFKVDEHHKA